MKKIRFKGNGMFFYGGAAIIIICAAAGLQWGLKGDSFLRTFFLRCWYIQILNTWLFAVAILYWIKRFSLFRSDERAFQKIVLPEYTIAKQSAQDLITSMPEEYKHTLTLRRFRELLRAFLYGEDLIRLNEELSRRDIAEVEKGHLILDSLRNIIPVIGFLGTVLGLSLGIVDFPDATDITALRAALKGFAASLSVAFDTTLLALGYTVGVALLIAYLRSREESLVTQVDERARLLLDKISFEEKAIAFSPESKDDFSVQNKELAKEIGDAIGENVKILIQKMDEMKEHLQRPPHYQVIVQPLKGQKDDE